MPVSHVGSCKQDGGVPVDANVADASAVDASDAIAD